MGLPGASWHPVMGAEVLGPEWERVGDGTVRDVPGGEGKGAAHCCPARGSA